MKKLLLLSFLTLTHLRANCQSLPYSIPGQYTYTTWIGGGFSGDGSGNCYALPPEAEIEHEISIDSSLKVTYVADTTFHTYITTNSLWGCNVEYLGEGILNKDTLIVTYSSKPICPFFNYLPSEEVKESDKYEELIPSIVEVYLIRVLYGKKYLIKLRDSDLDWEMEFEKSEEESN